MKRRTLLGAVGGSAGALGTAGCLQGIPGDSDGEPTNRTTDTSDDTTTDDESTTTDDSTATDDSTTTDEEPKTDDSTTTEPDPREWDPSGDPVDVLTVNDRDGLSFPDNNLPHAVVFWNRAESEREVLVEYGDGATEELESVGPVSVPADRSVQVDLQLPTHYTITVSVDGARFGTFEVGRDWFDCNSSASWYALGDGELVHYGGISTAAGCPTPTAAGTDLTVKSRDCGNEDDEQAVVGYGDTSVSVTGTVATPTPCYDLAVVETAYDAKRGTARVVVDATAQDEACVQCVGAIGYEARVEYENDFPDHVEVVHRTGGEDARVVAEASWNSDV